MGAGHAYDATSSGSSAARHQGRLGWALGLTVVYMLAEVIGGLLTGSLALLADAAHMLTDAGGLALALVAIRFAQRPATPQKTYGYLRAEILAALANAVALLLITVYILFEAYRRVLAPPEIISGPMLAVAAVGLVVNLASMRLLAGGSSESLNVRGAYFEMLADLLGSLGVILAALIVMFTGWRLADPIIGAAIGLFIVPRTWSLLKQVTHILLEGTPPEVDVALLERQLLAIPGVMAVHDAHVWTITSGLDAMSAHLVVRDMGDARKVLSAARLLMAREFKIEHVTIQIEDETFRPMSLRCLSKGMGSLIGMQGRVKMKLGVLLSACVLLASPSLAQQVKVVGPGTGSCAQFNADLRKDPVYEREYFGWAQGLMSGILLRAPASVDEKVDLLPLQLPVARQMQIIREYCAQHPDSDFFEAVRVLYREIKASVAK